MTIDLVKDRMGKALVQAEAHDIAADQLRRWHYGMGIPVVVLTTVVSTTAFTALSAADNVRAIAIGTGLLSMLAAVMASLQTFLSFGERSNAHAEASSRFYEFWRRMNRILDLDPQGSHLDEKRVEEIDEEFGKIIREAPKLSRAIRASSVQAISSRHNAPS
jgi:cell fate (sporulation/competence/biofilm development) regulator YlbF (YheA/YmcA/DUF963 family)